MFIPNTRRGTLLKMMRENEDSLAEMTGFRVSYSEAAGTKLGRLFSLDLAKNQPCGRSQEKCSSCNTDKIETNCKARCITYKSRCTLCNPEKKPDPSSPQEGEQLQDRPQQDVVDEVVADPSLGRVGIYIGESSRSIAERTTEHFNDAESFSKGSHIVKHWMKTHPRQVLNKTSVKQQK